MSDILFSHLTLGRIQLKNRVVMAPMTRSRATGNVPGEMVATYYAQRSEAGLIIAEGTSPSPNGLGYSRIPGLFSAQQVSAWKKVTDAVHKEGSRIFIQLMHSGRIGHPLNLPAGATLLAPSAVAAAGKIYTDAAGEQEFPIPKEMDEKDIANAINEFARSAELAIEAGFDGVELHGANGYLIDQFLNTASNHRKDRWGGSIENRMRFALEVARQTSERIGADRVGIRLSPYGAFNGMRPDAEHDALFTQLASKLSDLKLVYIHLVDHSSMGAPPVKDEIKQSIRKAFKGALILSGGYDAVRAEKDLTEKKCELVSFGRPFISNPKLVSKFHKGVTLIAPDFSTFYTPGEKGYIDYPLG